jgi:hypothetical protein
MKENKMDEKNKEIIAEIDFSLDTDNPTHEDDYDWEQALLNNYLETKESYMGNEDITTP